MPKETKSPTSPRPSARADLELLKAIDADLADVWEAAQAVRAEEPPVPPPPPPPSFSFYAIVGAIGILLLVAIGALLVAFPWSPLNELLPANWRVVEVAFDPKEIQVQDTKAGPVAVRAVDGRKRDVIGAKVILELKGVSGKLQPLVEGTAVGAPASRVSVNIPPKGIARFEVQDVLITKQTEQPQIAASCGRARASLPIKSAPTPPPTPRPVPSATVTPTLTTPSPEPPKLTAEVQLVSIDGKNNAQQAQPGQVVEYLIVVSNTGTTTATIVTVVCIPPLWGNLAVGSEMTSTNSGKSWEQGLGDIPVGSAWSAKARVQVKSDTEAGTTLTLRCTVAAQGSASQAVNWPLLVVAPPPTTPPLPKLQLAFDPPSFDVGIEETIPFTVRLTSVVNSKPVSDAQISLSIEPVGLARIESASAITSTTNISGEIKGLKLTAQQVGEGVLRAQLTGGAIFTTTLTVRPVVQVTADAAKLRSTPGGEPLASGAKAGDRFSVVGSGKDASEGLSWQIRLPDGRLAWIHSSVVKVTGATDRVAVTYVYVPPTATPTVTPLPTTTRTSTPTATPTTATKTGSATPTPTQPAAGGYPTEGSYGVKVSAGSAEVTLYMAGGTTDADVLATLPEGGMITVLKRDARTPEPPDGYALVALAFWVKVERLTQTSGGWTLRGGGSDPRACWDVKLETRDPVNCGVLGNLPNGYYTPTQSPDPRGEWRKIEVWSWVKIENIGASK